MYSQIKKKILYAPLLISMMLLSINTAQSQDAAVDYKNLEARIAGLEAMNKKLSVREAESTSNWRVAGYADVGFEFLPGENNDSFVTGKFNPAFHFQFKDWIMFESELQIETSSDGETEIEMEYSHINFLLHDNVSLVVGKFLSPIGQFQERLHPSWINRGVNMPAGFGHGGAQPISDTGIMLRGGIAAADDFTFTYAVAIGNGPRFGHDEDELELEGFGKDNDSNKSFGGRVAVVHKSSLEFGFSYLNAGITGEEEMHEGELEPAKKADYSLWGMDMAYSKGPWDIRAEYLNSKTTPVDAVGHAEPVTWKTWYTQVAYRLSGVSDDQIIGKFEPVLRYGELKVSTGHGLTDGSEKRWNAGLNYWAAPTIVVKAAVEKRNYFNDSRVDDTRYLFQVAYGF